MIENLCSIYLIHVGLGDQGINDQFELFGFLNYEQLTIKKK